MMELISFIQCCYISIDSISFPEAEKLTLCFSPKGFISLWKVCCRAEIVICNCIVLCVIWGAS